MKNIAKLKKPSNQSFLNKDYPLLKILSELESINKDTHNKI